MFLKRLTVSLLALLIVAAFALPAHARRPYAGEDAALTPKGHVEIGTGFEWENRSRTPGSYKIYGVPVRLDWGFKDGMDLSIESAMIKANRRGYSVETGPTDTRLILKKKLTCKDLAPNEFLAVYADAKLPTGDETKSLLLGTGKADLGLGLAYELHEGASRYRMSGSYVVAGDPAGIDFKNYITYAFGFERPTDRGIIAVAELSGRSRVVESDEASPLVLHLGAKKDLRKDLTFDIGFGAGLSEPTPNLIFKTGLTRRF